MAFLSGAFFDVTLVGPGAAIIGSFTSVSGLTMEADYEVYQEGGSLYPRFFFNQVKPQVLVLEQGVVTSVDSVSLLMGMVNQGMSVPMAGTVMLKDRFGSTQRVWTIAGAHLQRYVGPELNSNQPSLAVSRIELLYNGCY
ncbi:MAG: phage tail protein [Oscillospiraceae bacterium]|nr:phage tail protein [Oscillospiraceae bacterium]